MDVSADRERDVTELAASTRSVRRTAVDEVERVLDRVLELARDHLGMEVAWVSRIEGDEYRLRAVDGDPDVFGLAAGDEFSCDGTYCAQMLAGALPNLIPDIAGDRRAAAMQVTAELGVGAYVGVPIRLGRDEVYGTLCCLSSEASPGLDAKDIKFMEVLARVIGEQLERERAVIAGRARRRDRVAAAIEGTGLDVVFQPIMELRTRRPVGVEALARFTREPPDPPSWFADAAAVGLREELEVAAIRAALEQLDALPAGVYLSINASPETARTAALESLLTPVCERVQLELTEQAPVDDYDELRAALDRLRARGVRIAIDDAGAGYADLRHILRLSPDVIKLDMALTRDIDSDPARKALTSSLVTFATDVDAELVAEGVETEAELRTLLALGVRFAQGYLLARPAPLGDPAGGRPAAGGQGAGGRSPLRGTV